jgi:serine/threonine protein kinase, bacterial
MTALPELDGVQHRFVDLGDGVTIHVAEAGPPEGPPVMLVHGFPQHWWEWRELIGPLAADGYRVLCPDLRGAGWSSAPAGAYRKNDMADDLAAVLDRLHIGPVTLVAHDWGGFVAFIMMLRHPAKVTGFFGLNTGAPWVRLDRPLIRHLWRFWYQIPLAFPVVGPRIIADSRARYLRLVMKWVGAGYMVPENDFRLYASVLRDREHAIACRSPWLYPRGRARRPGCGCRWLGSGGMGEVYLAQHPRLPRPDALKILSSKVSADSQYHARFSREADVAATLYHPNIVGVHDRGEFHGQLWISMDYVDGTDAAQLVRDRYPNGMPPDMGSTIITAISAALDYAHDRGVLHRDVKPANILLTKPDREGQRRVLLADFGIARELVDPGGLTATNLTVGTVAYAAPEQLTGADVDARADQYALAATAFHLLTGAPPYEHSNPVAVISKHLIADPPQLGERRPELASLDEIFSTAMAKDPKHRFERSGDFARALADRISAIPGRERANPADLSIAALSTTSGEVRPQAPRRWPPKIVVPAIIATTAVIGLITFTSIHFSGTGKTPAAPHPSSATGSPPAAEADGVLDGAYRQDIDETKTTMNGQSDPNTNEPTLSEWIAFRSACTPAGCVARGTGLDYDNHQIAARYKGPPIVFHFADRHWQQTVSPGPATCSSNHQVIAANTTTEEISLTPQPDGSFQGTDTSTILTNECGGQGSVEVSPVVMMRIGDVPPGVTVPDPSSPDNATPPAPTAPPGPTGPITLGASCTAPSKLALDTNRQSVVCRDTIWQAAPRFTDVNTPATHCDQPGAKSISGDGYLLNCYSDTRTWEIYK